MNVAPIFMLNELNSIAVFAFIEKSAIRNHFYSGPIAQFGFSLFGFAQI